MKEKIILIISVIFLIISIATEKKSIDIHPTELTIRYNKHTYIVTNIKHHEDCPCLIRKVDE